FNRPLIKEPIEAWRYGPVIRNLYAELRYFGNQPVTEELLQAFDDDSLDREEAHIVNEVFQKYGRASGIALSNWTHLAQSPWDQTWRSQGQNAVIPNELMASYFRRLADDARSAAAARAAQ
ncbi:MAG: Panacea domain-containing protein, partial [Reyranella sp.]